MEFFGYLCTEIGYIVQMKKLLIETYGCQMNVHDSEEIKKILENLTIKIEYQMILTTIK